MNDEHGLLDFADRLRAEVIEESAGQSDLPVGDGPAPDFKENAFTRVMTGYLTDLGTIEDAEICHYFQKTGRGHVKVNGFFMDEEQGVLNLFISIYAHQDQPQHLTKTEITQAVERTERFFVLATGGHHLDMEPASDQFSMVQRIHELGDQIQHIRIHLLTDGVVDNATYEGWKRNGYKFSCQIWDLVRMSRCVASGLPYELIEIDFIEEFGQAIPCLTIEDSADDYTAYLAVFPGEILYKIYDDYGSRLLELNVRSFLQARGKVNRGIRDTLKVAPDRFLAYNNGISATAENIQIATSRGVPEISSIRGFQIVNGGQTIASIHRAAVVDKVDLSGVFVQAKLTIIDPDKMDEIVPLISRYANSQNRVNEADFSSNDPYHVEIQRLSETIWVPGEQSRWFYERARGQYQVAKARQATTKARGKKFEATTPTSQKFTKTDLAKFLNSWEQYPHIVSRGAQKNFVDFMVRVRKIHGKEWKPDASYYRDLVSKAILFKYISKVVRRMEFPAYRANAITYTMAYIAHRTTGRVNLAQVWETQGVTGGLEASIESWCPLIYDEITASASGRNVTEWCKKEECWERIRGLKLDVPSSLKDELSEGAPTPTVGKKRGQDGVLDFADQQNIARVMQVNAKAWFDVHDWGRKSGLLKGWQCGIAHTLSGYASGNWEKVPSAKQAKHGVAILEIARDHLNVDPASTENGD